MAAARTARHAPAGIDCRGDCAKDYPSGAAITLTATPDPIRRLSAGALARAPGRTASLLDDGCDLPEPWQRISGAPQ
ncbi:MAG: hypothetical protein U5O69_10355 [Candidatus Competibacteraceae bacterium]|nr:hypothetical protein [Candidatus Competibacteraceae bacterium]